MTDEWRKFLKVSVSPSCDHNQLLRPTLVTSPPSTHTHTLTDGRIVHSLADWHNVCLRVSGREQWPGVFLAGCVGGRAPTQRMFCLTLSSKNANVCSTDLNNVQKLYKVCKNTSLSSYSYATCFFFLLFASLLRQEDGPHFFDNACSYKEETGRACPLLISLTQTLVVNGKC